MFSENNLGEDYSDISKHELRLRVCHNERDIDESLRNITEYFIHYINSKLTMKLPLLVNISRIKKFKDLCDEDIVGRYASIPNIMKDIHLISHKLQLIVDIFKPFLNCRKYGLPILIILGLLGNCLSVIVLFRKKMRSFSCNIYLGTLAICDFVYSMKLLIDVLTYIMPKIMDPTIYYFSSLPFFLEILRTFCQFLSVWLIVAFTIERYIVTKYPFLRRSWCTVKRAKIVVIMLIGVAILHSIVQNFILFNTVWYKLVNKLVTKKTKKINIYQMIPDVHKLLNSDNPRIRQIIDSIIIFTLPALMIVICNTLIGYHIYQQNRLRKTLITASDFSGRTQISSDKMLQHKVTKMLILISSIFVILKLPQHFFFYISSYISDEYVNKSVVFVMSDLLDTAHYCINFVLYCATGQTFRRELIRIFTKRTNIIKNRNNMEMSNYK